jgi:hypothetical protein
MEGAAEFDKRRLHQKQEEEQEGGLGGAPAAPSRDDSAGGGGAAAAARLLRTALAAARRAQNGGAGSAFCWPGRCAGSVADLVARGAAGGWLVAPSEVELGPLLGAGAFGATYRARWHGADVAVKRVRVETEVELGAFLREVECLSGLRHPGIVPFLGAVLQVRGVCLARGGDAGEPPWGRRTASLPH